MYRWPEHYISGWRMAGALKKVARTFQKWLGNLEKETSEKITWAKKDKETTSHVLKKTVLNSLNFNKL